MHINNIQNALSRIFETDPRGFWVLGPHAETVAVNPAMAGLLAYSSEELTGLGLSGTIVNGSAEEFFSALTNGAVSGAQFRHKNGTPVALRFSAEKVDSGWLLNFLPARTETADAADTDLVADSFVDVFCALDTGGKIVKWNRALTRITGYTDAEIAAMRPADFVRSSDVPRVMDAIGRIWREGSAKLEVYLRTKTNKDIPFEFIGSQIMSRDGRLAGCTIVGRNLTVRQEAQRQIMDATAPDRETKALSAADSPLSEILDVTEMQTLLEKFSEATGLNTGILESDGTVLVATGWQDMCVKYHRLNPETAAHCRECNLKLISMLKPGEYASLKCDRGLWNIATPLYMGGKFKGVITTSQFFIEGESVDSAFYEAQAEKFGFDKAGYMAALAQIKTLSQEKVKTAMEFLIKLSDLVSRLSYGNIQLSQMMAEQKRAEMTIRKSAEEFRRLLQRAPLAIAVQDSNGKIEYINDRLTRAFGYTIEDIPDGEAFWAVTIPDAARRESAKTLWRAAAIKARKSGEDIQPLEFRVQNKNGEQCLVEMFGTRIGEKNLVIFADITKRRQGEEELARHRDHLEELVWQRTSELTVLSQIVYGSLEAADVGAWWIDFREDDTYHALDTMVRMYGLAPVSGKNKKYRLSDWIAMMRASRNKLPQYAAMMDDALNLFDGAISGKYDSYYSIYPFMMPDGTLKWFEERSDVSARDGDGRALFMSGTLIDVTRLKTSEENLLRARETAEHASRAKSEFLATMSHELRTPLNSIIGFAQVLGEESFGSLTESQKDFAKDIEASGKHLLSLINDILDFSKIESGKMVLEPEPVRIDELLESSLTMIKEKARRHNLQLTTAFDSGMPPVKADVMRIRQVVYNLLANAAKSTPDGGSIHVSAEYVDGEAEVAVADTGIGIDEGDQSRIFRQFEQVVSGPARKYGGTGLGLSISRDIVELHGGRIWVESEGLGRGSRFVFRLPLK